MVIRPGASTSFVLTGLTVLGGRTLRGEDPVVSDRILTGSMIYVLGLAVMNQYSPDFAAIFALLVLVAATLIYGLDIMRALGFKLQQGE